MEASWSSGESTSLAVEILRKIARLEGDDVADLPPLGRTIDVEAVEQVAQTEGTRISFRYLGYEVVVADGQVAINDR
ncbi:HalOD1 output domain-containing protein [Halobellus limi]|jgi:hypothetical protein|uniref:Halobacterial output domain-containing protein n=1 Tax=Halobellus limi TaxID=699433 RepID=A0A1H5TNB0_9EURY|nr:HalOD1 output domain-containing protein [Halobellus limi]QCC47269.1 hypothetical protein DV707_06070 [Halobellus limi]SEF64342.1 hypothetical protein SAMN04488133_0334 [Halobellus limi]